MRTPIRYSIALTILAATFSLSGAVLDDWRPRHPVPYYAGLWSAAYGNGVYVIVGDGGMIVTSSDLLSWHSKHHPGSLSVENVVFGDAQFVATGYTGEIVTSTDGTNWTTHPSGTSLPLRSVDYANGLYVAAGQQGVSAVSSNGVNWSIGSTGDTNYQYWGIAHSDSLFVAAGTHGDYDGSIRIVTSSNGVDWAEATLPGGLPPYTELWDIGYGNGRFTAVGYWEIYIDDDNYTWGPLVLTSDDGTNWTRVNDPDIPFTDNSQWAFWTVDYDGSQWIGIGQAGLLMTSADGLDWSLQPRPLGTGSALYGIAVGAGGHNLLVGSRGAVYSSPDLTSWVNHFSGTYQDFSKVAFNGSQYLACGVNAYVSTDGATWPYYFDRLGGTITGIAYGKGRWVISSFTISGTKNSLSTSTNGMDWELVSTSDDFDDCQGVAFGNGLFVALPKSATNTSLAYSTDGLNWTETSHPWFDAAQNQNHIAFGGGQFFSWGYSNSSTMSIVVSADGVDWQVYDTGIEVLPLPVAGAYGNGRWVLVGYNGAVITSTNLTDWTEQTILFAGETLNLNGVAYGAGQWVIVGRGQHIWSSTDGVNWEEAFWTQLGVSSWFFSDVAFDGNSFWVVGAQGAIYQSQTSSVGEAPMLAIRKAANPMQIELLIDGVTGQMWDLVYSDVLPANVWSYLSSITLTNNNHIHVQNIPEGSTGRYYRLRSP